MKHLFDQLSPEGAGLTMIGTVVTTVVAAVLRAKLIVAREQRAMEQVPPTPSAPKPVASPTAVSSEALLQMRTERLETLLRRERWRISEYERQATELGRDHAATASALAAERAKTEHLERYVKELEERLRAIASGHTPSASLLPPPERVTVRPRPSSETPTTEIVVIEVDNRPTPRHGMPAAKDD